MGSGIKSRIVATPALTESCKAMLLEMSGRADHYRLLDSPMTQYVFNSVKGSRNRMLHFEEKQGLVASQAGTLVLRLRLNKAHQAGPPREAIGNALKQAVLVPSSVSIDWPVDPGRQDVLELHVLHTAPDLSIMTLQFPSTAGKYVLDVADLRAHPICILNNVQEMRAQETGDDSETSTTISTWSHAQFEVVYRALSSLPITLSMLRDGCEALRFFGIPLQPVFQRTLAAGCKPPILATHDIICGGPDGIDMADTAKAMGLPYVRFHIQFADGDITYMRDDEYGQEAAKPVHIQPSWLSLGDFHNVAAMMRLNTSHRYEAMTGPQLLDAGVMDESGGFTEATGLKYAVGLPESYAPRCLDDHVGFNVTSDEPLSAVAPLLWPGSGDCLEDRQITTAHARLFHIDSSGRTCFTPDEASATIKRLKQIRFIEQIRAALIALVPVLATPSAPSNSEMSLMNLSLYGIVWLG